MNRSGSASILRGLALVTFAAAAPAIAHAQPTGDPAATAAYAPSAQAMPTFEAPTEPASVPRRTTGQVLTFVGIAHLVAGSAVMGVYMTDTCQFCGLVGLVIGGPVLVSGVAVTAVGIPLWVSGAKEVPRTGPAAANAAPFRGAVGIPDSAYIPRLQLGVGTIGVVGSF